SICSVTAIVPSSAVMPAPTRPPSMSAVSTGPISRTSEMPTMRDTNILAPNRSMYMPSWSASTIPVNMAVRLTIESDFQPICSSCSTTTGHSGRRRVAVRRTSRVRSPTSPSGSTNPSAVIARGRSAPGRTALTASAPAMADVDNGGRSGLSNPAVGLRVGLDPRRRLAHQAVEEEHGDEEPDQVVRRAEDQHGDEGGLVRNAHADEYAGHRALHHAEAARHQRDEREQRPDTEPRHHDPGRYGGVGRRERAPDDREREHPVAQDPRRRRDHAPLAREQEVDPLAQVALEAPQTPAPRRMGGGDPHPQPVDARGEPHQCASAGAPVDGEHGTPRQQD